MVIIIPALYKYNPVRTVTPSGTMAEKSRLASAFTILISRVKAKH
jgi:hypothetical protein